MSRARDIASSGVTSTVLSAKAPLASPDFTGTVDLTGTTLSLDNDQISGDKVSGGTIGAGTFNGTIGSSASLPTGTVVQVVQDSWVGKTSPLTSNSSWTETGLTRDIQVSSGNSVLVECVMAVEVITAGTNGLVALASRANDSDPTSSDFIINPWMIQGLAVADNIVTTGQFLHANPQSSLPQRYKVFVKPESSSYAVQFGAETSAGYFHNTLTLYEIQT